MNGHFKTSRTKPTVKPIDALLLTLWILGNQECFRSAADRFHFSRGHAYKIFIQTTKMIYRLRFRYIKWPEGNELQETVAGFNQFRENPFPNVAGCVDGTHILIPGPQNDNSYYNRKGTHSVILQVCMMHVPAI